MQIDSYIINAGLEYKWNNMNVSLLRFIYDKVDSNDNYTKCQINTKMHTFHFSNSYIFNIKIYTTINVIRTLPLYHYG